MHALFYFISFFFALCSVSAQPLDPDISLISETRPTQVKDASYYRLLAGQDTNLNEALGLLTKAISLRTKAQDNNWLADVRVEKALLLLKMGNSKQAFSELLTARKIYTNTQNNTSKADVLDIIANFYKKNAAWDEAEQYYKEVQELREIEKDTLEAASVSLLLTEIALNQNDLEEANRYVSRAIEQYQSLNNKKGLGISYVKLAEIYRRENQYAKGERLILKSALPLFSSAGYQTGRIGCFDVLGKIYRSQKKYSQAKWFFIQANTQSRILKDVEGIINSLVNLGKVKVDIGDYKLAKRDFNEAETLASKRDDLFLMANVKDAFSFLSRATGNKEDADRAAAQSGKLRDSLAGYYAAALDSANTAKIIREPVVRKKPPGDKKAFNFAFVLKIIGTALLLIGIIYLILRRLK